MASSLITQAAPMASTVRRVCLKQGPVRPAAATPSIGAPARDPAVVPGSPDAAVGADSDIRGFPGRRVEAVTARLVDGGFLHTRPEGTHGRILAPLNWSTACRLQVLVWPIGPV